MSSNIQQIFIANPATTLQPTDIFYLGRSPYGLTDDMACLFSTIQAAIPNATWSEVTGTAQNITPNAAYIANNVALVTFTLPAAAAVGTTFRIAGKGAGGWAIAQGAGQSINDGSVSSTIGAGGSIASTQRYNAIELVCITANTTWNVISSQGNFTIV